MAKTEEILSIDSTKDTEKKFSVLFVCTGNTCRSPMAAAIFNHLYNDGTRHALSAGLAAYGDPISENAKVVLMERGVLPTPENDYPSHISRRLDTDMLEKADLIVGLTSSHAMSIMMAYPAYASKIAVMPHDISDPYGGSTDDYRRTLNDIEESLREAFGNCESNTAESEG